jgi:hypothetical protein
VCEFKIGEARNGSWRQSHWQIAAQVAQLPFNERLRLMHRIIDTLPLEVMPPQYLVYGQFQNARMSTEEDFLLAEWRPKPGDLNGP